MFFSVEVRDRRTREYFYSQFLGPTLSISRDLLNIIKKCIIGMDILNICPATKESIDYMLDMIL
jgi:hypothetical protein